MATCKHVMNGSDVWCTSEIWGAYTRANTAYEAALINKKFDILQTTAAQLTFLQQQIRKQTTQYLHPGDEKIEQTGAAKPQNRSKKSAISKASFKFCKLCGKKISFIASESGIKYPVNYGTAKAHRCKKEE